MCLKDKLKREPDMLMGEHGLEIMFGETVEKIVTGQSLSLIMDVV